ncbi:MAG: NADH-quinone oxidoreductase subunit NuoK [Planctomycetota bacterium]|nr:NADH-quinone oxidoreductase subunit NuoK [Planctomycetota bacterium]
MSDLLLTISLPHFLVVSFLLLAAGISTMLTKRNAIGILIGVELVLNAAAINFVAFNHYGWPGVRAAPAIDGQMFAIFIIVLAAAEASVALAIFLNFYNNFGSIDVERADDLKA